MTGQATLRVKKTYSFGHDAVAELTTYHGTKRCKVVKHDPVGTYQSVVIWCENYETAHGIAKLHALQMTAKYGSPFSGL